MHENTLEEKVRWLLDAAIREGASDLHIEEWPDGVRSRIRVDGVVRLLDFEPLEHREHLRRALVSVLELDALQMVRTQQGSISHGGYCFRVSVLPTSRGSVRYCMRLAREGQAYSLDAYQMPESDDKRAIREAIGAGDGGIIVSGPTGSGKTSLLYSILGSLDPHGEMVTLTFEDPIENSLARYGISQTQISPLVPFHAGLREALRQDPDAMLIGETRDTETAKIFLEGARTGHLLFTTLHVNTALECVDRMESLGMNREMLLSVLRFATCQRLVPKLCQDCKTPDDDLSALVSRTLGRPTRVFSAGGCPHCKGKGVKGRVLIFEWIAVKNRKLVPSETMLQRAIRYAEGGLVSAYEIFALNSGGGGAHE